MRTSRVLDLDGSLTAQSSLFSPEAAEWVPRAVGTADSPGLLVRNLRTFPPLARRCVRDR